MKFKYVRFGDHLRPVIPIKVRRGTSSVLYNVLVDSGADSCVFDALIAPSLGIVIEEGRPARVGGVGGQTATYFIHPLTIEVGGSEFHIEAGFLPLVAGGFNYGVVGQDGFFEHFVVRFDLLKEEIELRSRRKV